MIKDIKISELKQQIPEIVEFYKKQNLISLKSKTIVKPKKKKGTVGQNN
jgi:hypothetical protein